MENGMAGLCIIEEEDEAMHNTSANLWNSLGGTQISDLGEKSFLFIFFHLLDIKRGFSLIGLHEVDRFDFGDEFRGEVQKRTGEVYGNVCGLGSPQATSRLQQMLKFYHPQIVFFMETNIFSPDVRMFGGDQVVGAVAVYGPKWNPPNRTRSLTGENFEVNPCTITKGATNGSTREDIARVHVSHGKIMEDPNQHLKRFLQLYNTFKYNGVIDDMICLWLFPFFLCDKAYEWLDSQDLGSITTWDHLARTFLHKIFPISQSIQLRHDIANFKQYKGKNLYEAWELFKSLLRKCPHHGMQDWLQLQIFYNGLDESLRAGLDGTLARAFMNNTYKRACQLIKDMGINSYIWPNERFSYS
ncbi:hypothetical protein Goshw_012997 [Gossypium schwendimanii]|uniref:Retrotransposon gag domain-containing protein n=1 Tax=Gossypium schwendimanii TaxID=34291 RepID=A0A7J9N553_GOSSC|nr:hypothetical protein [Gossypium schwendimanii]